jgi:hypothetical protein
LLFLWVTHLVQAGSWLEKVHRINQWEKVEARMGEWNLKYLKSLEIWLSFLLGTVLAHGLIADLTKPPRTGGAEHPDAKHLPFPMGGLWVIVAFLLESLQKFVAFRQNF